MSSFAENLKFPERKQGPEKMRTNLATVLDPTRRSNDARDFEAALRRKIESDPARPRYLLTEQGVGYRLADE